jgi:glycosyltransferase involved in cell wall biosynthesis
MTSLADVVADNGTLAQLRLQRRSLDAVPSSAANHQEAGVLLPCTGTERKTRILHLVESFGGGVQSAMQAYIENCPDVDHCILAHARDDVGASFPEAVQMVYETGSLRSQYVKAMELIKECRPDAIHAHSSWAGLYGRILGRRTGIPVVYSPHAFAFLRTDTSSILRRCFRMAERHLSRSTFAFATASSYEWELAQELAPNARNFILYPSLAPSTQESSLAAGDGSVHTDPERSFDIAILGRIVAQKGPEFVVETIGLLRERGWTGRAKWIGCGSDKYVQQLTDVGVEVTGWLPRDEALESLTNARVFLHTAAWEAGVPYAVLEAAAMSLPIVMRTLASSSDYVGYQPAATARECALALERLLGDPHSYAAARNDSKKLVSSHWGEMQRISLMAVYQAAAEASQLQRLGSSVRGTASVPVTLSPDWA